MIFGKDTDREIKRLTRSIAYLLGLDPDQYRVNISFVARDNSPKFQELKR